MGNESSRGSNALEAGSRKAFFLSLLEPRSRSSPKPRKLVSNHALENSKERNSALGEASRGEPREDANHVAVHYGRAFPVHDARDGRGSVRAHALHLEPKNQGARACKSEEREQRATTTKASQTWEKIFTFVKKSRDSRITRHSSRLVGNAPELEICAAPSSRNAHRR